MVVFHRPPLAVPTYHTLRFRGSTATSAMRPEENVPRIFRIWRSFTVSAVSRGAEPVCARISPRVTAATGIAYTKVRFIGLILDR